MLELINDIKKIYREEGEKVFIDKTTLSPGYYIKLTNNPLTTNDLFEINSKIDKDNIEIMNQYNWFKERAFYNFLLNNTMNKGVQSSKKQIISVIPQALVFKAKNLYVNEFDSYVKLYLEELCSYANGDLDVDYYYNIYINKLNELRTLIKNSEIDIKETDKILFFMQEDIESYKKSYEFYLEKKLFLSDKYCIEIDNNKLGVGSFSMTLNVWKPTLSSTKYKISLEDAKIINLISKLNYHINEILNEYCSQKYYIEFKNSDIKAYSKNGTLEKYLNFPDYFILRDEKSSSPTPKELKRYQLVSLIDSEFSHGALNNALKIDIKENGEALNNYIKSINKIFTDISIIQYFISYRDLYFDYFINQGDISISNNLETLLKKIFEYKYIQKEKRVVLCSKFDMILNIMVCVSIGKDRFIGMSNNIKKIKNELIEFKRNNVLKIDNDETFYFIAGQLLQYFASITEAFDKSYQDNLEYSNLRNIDRIKRKIIEKYSKYSYKLPTYSNAFINLAYQEVLSYGLGGNKVKNITKTDLWYYYNAGLVGENIFFIKVKKEETVEDE